MLTLKLSHVNWTGAPYRWRYEIPVTAWAATNGNSVEPQTWKGEVSYSGDAYFMEMTVDEVEKSTGLQFINNRLFEDQGTPGASVYVRLPFRDTTEYAIWKMNDVAALPADFDIDKVTFDGLPCENIEAWIGGVRQVTCLGEVAPGKGITAVLDGSDTRFAHLRENLEIWTWCGSGKSTVRKVIMVRLDDGETRSMLVERAWLLGPNGDTIQKVAP